MLPCRTMKQALRTLPPAARHAALCDGMEHAGLDQERRALVASPLDIDVATWGGRGRRFKINENDGVLSARNAYEEAEFLTSTDERFRPVNLANGPDGGLYVVDIARGLIQIGRAHV